ncbi:hypothetical protein BJX66DRAFT_345238 [Aspergillus keveii]|uniref:G-protein coupled receptors family 2 profile 2 domain-containing protein n=1 Tax=Aspergillus keveii TaxID=714993 RepID=A0ABR4FIN7_9EURO
MASNSSLTQCPDPFIAELSFENSGGYDKGRWCQPFDVADESISCCFPCPITDWRYSDGFNANMVPWIGLAVLILMVISALTYIVLPTSATQRHYLTSSPLMGFIFMSIAFIIPLGPSVEYCYDAITPNYWLSDTTCAFSGSLLLYGVWVLVIGCFFRSASLYLQLCWDVEPGTKFRAISIICIFLGSLGMLGIALGVSGVSYQVGDVCYISYPGSIGSFWGPLIGVAFISFAMQLFIMGYCIRGVLTRGGTARFSIFKRPGSPSELTTAVPSRSTSTRVWRILQLQWRAIAIACLILFHVVYVGQAVLRFRDPAAYSDDELQPWIDCLIGSKGDQEACLGHASRIEPNQATVVSALALLAATGFWGVICTVRWSMVIAWLDWTRDRKDDFMDFVRGTPSRERPNDLERVSSDADAVSLTTISSPTTLADVDQIYGTRKYHRPQNSFSAPGRISTLTGTTVTTISSSQTYDLKSSF